MESTIEIKNDLCYTKQNMQSYSMEVSCPLAIYFYDIIYTRRCTIIKTKKQRELIEQYLSQLAGEEQKVYRELIEYLSELGYNPKKEGLRISFKHDSHNKQIAKIGMSKGKQPRPIFKLRFSACRDYSGRFKDIVNKAVSKDNFNESRCIYGNCDFCAGEAKSHVYAGETPDGTLRYHCGSSALEIPDIKAEDSVEIKRLMKEEHIYLMKNEAGIEVENGV